MANIQTIHENVDGEQETRRVVTVEDAAGKEYEYEFLVVDGEHEYQGEGEPSDGAKEALEEFLKDA
ncbi:hypothetical protein [Halostella sp. PRR32]|uniref:hypothetical protein n=1 Tax=Halostella sp. PRR32 TaxID=3098147 RepID=UPI002B1E627D|nr:hypothetical protein [Halostella sp. PRR32]